MAAGQTPFYFLGCAYAANQPYAEMALRACCHDNFLVTEVRPLRVRRKPYCRWNVVYNWKPHLQRSYDAGKNTSDAFLEICKVQPNDANIHQISRCEAPASFHVVYKVRCSCQSDFNNITKSNSDECALSIHLKNSAISLSSREELDIAEFAKSLIVFPKTLAESGAKDATDLAANWYHNFNQIKLEDQQQG